MKTQCIFMSFIEVDGDKYIKGMFELFKESCEGDIVEQILNNYNEHPEDSCARDAFNLAKLMYYASVK